MPLYSLNEKEIRILVGACATELDHCEQYSRKEETKQGIRAVRDKLKSSELKSDGTKWIWTSPTKRTDAIPYDHVTCDTALGRYIITWESSKKRTSFSLEVFTKFGNTYLGDYPSLEKSKEMASKHLTSIYSDLTQWLVNLHN